MKGFLALQGPFNTGPERARRQVVASKSIEFESSVARALRMRAKQRQPERTWEKVKALGIINVLVALGGALIILVLMRNAVAAGRWHAFIGWLFGFAYYCASWRVINAAHWGSIEVVGHRLPAKITILFVTIRGVVKEGLRFTPWLLTTLREFSGELSPEPIKGVVQLRDGTQMTIDGSVDFVRDPKVLTLSGAPRYPEVHRQIESGVLGKRCFKLIGVAGGYCTLEDVWRRDEAVQILLSFVLMVDPIKQPHLRYRWRSEEVVRRYDRDKPKWIRLLNKEVSANSRNEVEFNFAVKVVGHSINFVSSTTTREEEQTITAAKTFREAQRILEEGDNEGDAPRMTPEQSRQTAMGLGPHSRRIQIEHIGDSSGAPKDPIGLQGAAAILTMGQDANKPKKGGSGE